jgi:putative ABC transport system permease protein
LAAVGIYGTIAYSVSRRTHEIGVRMALGAQRRQVLKLVIGQGIGMLLVGEVIGLMGASAANQVLSKMFIGFFGITTADKVVYMAVSSIVAAISLVAAYLPARKAMAVDPLQALKCE